MAEPIRVVFVCMGNICRSPMAEAVMRRRITESVLADQVTVASAGTGGWHVGDEADPRARAALARRGYHLQHQARQFDRTWFERVDLVVALDRSNRRALRSLAPDAGTRESIRLLRSFDASIDHDEEFDVPDPYYGGPEGFDAVLDMIESACAGLLGDLQRVAVG